MKIRFRLTLALLLLFAGSAGAQVLLPSPQTVNAADSGTACVTVPAACATWSIGSAPSVTFQVTGTMTSMTLTFEATADGQTWFSIMPIKQSTGVSATTTTATGQFSISNPGYLKVRTRCTTYASGAANLTLTRGTALSARAYNIGTLGTTNGGTGFASYAVGDLLSADTTTSLSKVPAVATGQVLASAGANTLPAYTATPTVTSVTATAGAGTQTGKLGGINAYADFATTGSTGGGAAADVSSYTMPENTLSANGQRLLVEVCARHAANTNATTLNVWLFGSAQSASNAVSGGIICAWFSVVRTTSSTVTYHGVFYPSFAAKTGEVAALDFTATNILKYSVQAATTTNDLIGNYMRVAWFP